jgi:ElaB/YqjD/DUF883 family membrane-anchored ribosome-binding protein
MNKNLSTEIPDNRTDTTGRSGQEASTATSPDQMTKHTVTQSQTDLFNHLESFKTDLDALLSRASMLSESELKVAYADLIKSLSSFGSARKNQSLQATSQVSRQLKTACAFVKEHPMQSIGLAAGVGTGIGALLSFLLSGRFNTAASN